MNPVKNILHKAIKKKTFNILTFPTHERYETGLALTGHNFYAFRLEYLKDWTVKYANLPDNYVLLDPKYGINQLPPVGIDFILSQSKFGQFQKAKELSELLHVPLISLEHTLPVPQWNENKRKSLKEMRGNINIFISSFSIKEWGFDEADPTVKVIKHMVDTDVFYPGEQFMSAVPYNPRENRILSVVNDWINRDWCCNYSGWQRITKGLPVHVVGDTPGLSITASSTQELVSFYRNSSIFLNTSTISPVPTALLEAMACGCAVVSTATCMIPEVIEHGVDGFISNNEEELRDYCKMLLLDNKLAKQMGYNAQQKIEKHFNKNTFITSWNKTFDEASEMFFTGDK